MPSKSRLLASTFVCALLHSSNAGLANEEAAKTTLRHRKRRRSQETTLIYPQPPEPAPQQYIVGGNRAPVDRYSYYASVYQRYGSSNYHICGASLIHDDILITAAHCAMDADSVRIGAYTHFANSNGGAKMHQSDVADFITHPQFYADRYNRLHFDFALLKLNEPVTDPDLLKSIVKLDLNGEYSDQYETVGGEPLTAIGLGQIEEEGDVAKYLQEVDISYVPRERCFKIFQGGIGDDAICAVGDGKDACGGDSGGPLILKAKNNGEADVQVGVVSWGAGCSWKHYPGVYSNIPHVGPWIQEELCKLTSVKSGRFGCSPPESNKADSDPLHNADLTFGSSDIIFEASSEENACRDKSDCSSIASMRWHRQKVWCAMNGDSGKCDRTCGLCDDKVVVADAAEQLEIAYDQGRSSAAQVEAKAHHYP